MTRQLHQSRRHLLDISFDGSSDADRLQNDLSRVYHQRLVPMFDEVMTEIVGPDETLAVDRLELHTPPVHPDALETDWVEAVRRELTERLLELRARRPRAGAAVEPTARHRIRYLEFFLCRGYAPWWRPDEDTVTFERLFLELLEDEPRRVAAAIRDVGREAPARRRLVRQLSQEALRELVRVLGPEAAAAIGPVLLEASPRPVSEDRPPSSDAILEERVWEEALALLIEPPVRRWTTAEFAAALRRRLATPEPHQSVADARRGRKTDPAAAVFETGPAELRPEQVRPPTARRAAAEEGEKRRPDIEAALDAFGHFLVHGVWPEPEPAAGPDRLAERVARLRRGAPKRLASLLRTAAESRAALGRLAALPPPILQSLLEVLAPDGSPRIVRLVDELARPRQPARATDLDKRRLRRAVWRIVLGRLLGTGEAAPDDPPRSSQQSAVSESPRLAAPDWPSSLLDRLPGVVEGQAGEPGSAELAAQVRRLSDALRHLAGRAGAAADWRLPALEAVVGLLMEREPIAPRELIAEVVDRIARRTGAPPEMVAARLRKALAVPAEDEAAVDRRAGESEEAAESPAGDRLPAAGTTERSEPPDRQPPTELAIRLRRLVDSLPRLVDRTGSPEDLWRTPAILAIATLLLAPGRAAPRKLLVEVVERIARRTGTPPELVAARLREALAAPTAEDETVVERHAGERQESPDLFAEDRRPATETTSALEPQDGELIPELQIQVRLLMETLRRWTEQAAPAAQEGWSAASEAIVALFFELAPVPPRRLIAEVVERIARRREIPAQRVVEGLESAAREALTGAAVARFASHLRRLAATYGQATALPTEDRPPSGAAPAPEAEPAAAPPEPSPGAPPGALLGAPPGALLGAPPGAPLGARPGEAPSRPADLPAAPGPPRPAESPEQDRRPAEEEAALTHWLEIAWPVATGPGATLPRLLRRALDRDPAAFARRLRAHAHPPTILRRLAPHLDAELFDRLAAALRPEPMPELSRLLATLLAAVPAAERPGRPPAPASTWRPVIAAAILRPLVESPGATTEELVAAIASELVAAGWPLEARQPPADITPAASRTAPQSAATPAERLARMLDELARTGLADSGPPAAAREPAADTAEGPSIRERAAEAGREGRGEEQPAEAFIANAGLVLLRPFLGRYFELTGLMAEGRFHGDEAAERAVHLTQLLLGGHGPGDEPALALNKLLCGLPLEHPVRRSIEVTDEERDLARDLLEHAIRTWTKIQNTSVEGFQTSFLARRGRLAEQEEHWRLAVEGKAFDMLLDTLPWSISVVKTVWMKKPILVDWL